MCVNMHVSLYTEPNVNRRPFSIKSCKVSKIFTVFTISILCDVFVVGCALCSSSLEKDNILGDILLVLLSVHHNISFTSVSIMSDD